MHIFIHPARKSEFKCIHRDERLPRMKGRTGHLPTKGALLGLNKRVVRYSTAAVAAFNIINAKHYHENQTLFDHPIAADTGSL